MILVTKNLHVSSPNFVKICLSILLFGYATASYAVVYNFPGNASAPLELQSGDSLNVLSGRFQNTTLGSAAYTIALHENTTTSIYPGASITYDATPGATAAIFGVPGIAGGRTIYNTGTISNGLAQYLIFFNSTTPGDDFTLYNQGTMFGDVSVSNMQNVVFNCNGNAQNYGNLVFTYTGTSTMTVGDSMPTNYTANGSITGLTSLQVFNGASLTVTDGLFFIEALTIDSGATANIYNTINSGTPLSDGDIVNSGILYLHGNVNKYGSFVTTGTTNFLNSSVVLTADYDASSGTHAVNLYDPYTMGSVEFTIAEPDFNIFAVGYSGGYFAQGSYTLVTAPSIGTAPSSYTIPAPTMFLSFATPTVVGNTIQIALTRTPFQTYLTDGLSHRIATILEEVGANSPSQAMVNLLDGLEKSANSAQLNSNLYQLLPLLSAPMYTFMLQDQAFEQVSLRIAETKQLNKNLRSTIYSSGERSHDYNIWFRAIADRANQNPTGNTTGYYANTGGGVMGLDKFISPTFLFGAALSATQSTVDDKINDVSYTNIKSYQVMLYSSIDMLPAYLNMAAAIANNKYHGVRNVNFNQYIANSTGAYGNHQYGAKVEYGVNYRPRNYVQVTPEASVLYSYATGYRYNEGGGDGTDLLVLADGAALAQFAAGFKLSFPFMQSCTLVIPELHLKGLYNISNGTQNMTANFLGGGGQFISRAGLPKSGIRYGAAITLAKIQRLDFKLNYDHTAMEGYTDNMFYLNFRYTL